MKGLYVVAAVAMAGVSSVFALLAVLEEEFDLTTTSLGWIAGSAFLAALVTQLWLSRYADRGYASLLLRSGVIVSAVGLIWFGLSSEIWEFVAARALLGAGVGMIIPPARRAIVLTSDGAPGEKLGTFYAAYLAGFVFGPPIAGVLAEVGNVRLPFLVFGGLVGLSLFSILRVQMPEASPEAAAPTAEQKMVLRRLLRRRNVLAALLVVISFRYSIGVFEPLWATHLDDQGASTRLITLSLTSFALPMLLVARPAGRLGDRLGSRYVSVLAALATVPMMATYGYSPYIWLILLVAVPHGLMEAMLSPASQTAIAEASPEEDTAAAQGLAEASGSGAAAFGAFTAPWVFDQYGSGAAWLAAGAIMGGLLGLSWWLDPPRRRKAEQEPSHNGASQQSGHAADVVGRTDGLKIEPDPGTGAELVD